MPIRSLAGYTIDMHESDFSEATGVVRSKKANEADRVAVELTPGVRAVNNNLIVEPVMSIPSKRSSPGAYAVVSRGTTKDRRLGPRMLLDG